MSKSGSPKKQETQADLARRALDAKQKAEQKNPPHHPESQTAHEGQINQPRADEPPMGALDAEGQRPVLERSRKVR